MKIAIAGGTGTLGRYIVEELRGRGHEVRVLSRKSPDHPVDLTSGAGLAEALEGCEVVVDAANSTSPKLARLTLVDGSRRLLAAEQKAGVRHHVCVSIVGCDKAPMSYYAVKVQQEHVVEQGDVPWSIVRATQFHELAVTILGAAGRWRVLPLPKARLQTIAAAEAALAVADVAENDARMGRVNVAGPEIRDLRDLARTWRATTGRRALMVPLLLPGKLGRALRAGALTDDQPDVRGRTTFAAWLAAQQQ
jgi:uncharacterized protein YbjT (DUF2867 family)